MDTAETDAARAQAAGISPTELAARDEADRLARMPDAVEPENQEAITKSVEQVQEEEMLDAIREQDAAEIDPDDPEQIAERYEEMFYGREAEERTHEMQAKLNDQHEAIAPSDASVESSESTSNSLFGFDGDASGDDGEAQTNDQDTVGGLFGEGQSQDNDNSDSL